MSAWKNFNTRYFVSLWQYLRCRHEDIAAFFLQLLAICRTHGFFQRASTQELMCLLLVELAQQREDANLLMDLLRYDWLRCGHRQLPDCLALPPQCEQPSVTRDILYKQLPAAMIGLYDSARRNQFCKRLTCIRISTEALWELGYSWAGSGRICFLAEREATLYGHSRVLMPEQDDEASESSVSNK